MRQSIKFAIIHDWIIDIGGAEICLKEIFKLFPDAHIFTLIKKDETLRKLGLPLDKVTESFISRIPGAEKRYRSYLPLFPIAVEQLNVSNYDVIISSSHAVAKGVLTTLNQLHICYCHTPIRYAWDLYYEYIKDSKLDRGLKGIIARLILHYIRMWDISTKNRPDFYIANSKYIAQRIKKIYGKDATVIYPPVYTDRFKVTAKKENFYLTVSRIVPYKKIGLIVQAFSRMLDKKLVVIGDGPGLNSIKDRATKNVEFLGYQPFQVVKEYMQKAKAFIIAAEEDFGIAPVEAQACGTPVIAYGRGGALETVINGQTGLFFYKQDIESLIKAIRKFEKLESKFDPYIIRENAEKFNVKRFRKKLFEYVDEKINFFFYSNKNNK